MCASGQPKNSQFWPTWGREAGASYRVGTDNPPVASQVANSQAQVGFNDMPIVVAIKIFVINYKYVEIAATVAGLGLGLRPVLSLGWGWCWCWCWNCSDLLRLVAKMLPTCLAPLPLSLPDSPVHSSALCQTSSMILLAVTQSHLATLKISCKCSKISVCLTYSFSSALPLPCSASDRSQSVKCTLTFAFAFV